MRLTTKGRYAVTALLDLALHHEQGPVTLADISQRQAISLSYLEQLFAKLRRQELVSSARGPGGGYCLSRPAANISVAAVITAVDDSVDATRCHGQENCQGEQRCLTHELWEDLSKQIYGFLDQISLADLMARHSIRAISARQEAKVVQLVQRPRQHEALPQTRMEEEQWGSR